MNFTINKFFKQALVVAGSVLMLASCNKDVPAAEPKSVVIDNTSPTLADLLNDPTFSILKAAVTKASTSTNTPSLAVILANRSAVYTVFAPTDAAFQLSGIPSVAALAAFSAGRLDTLLRYHIVGGQALTSALIPSTFPNLQVPSLFVLSPPTATVPPGLRMSLFPSKRGTSLWVNNIPLVQTDVMAANGVLHKTATLVSPPSTTIKGILASNPANYSILLAAIQRADSAQTGLSRLDSVINYPPANLTLFAPNNAAFRAMFPPGTPDANIIGALNTPSLFTATTVRGIIAYHLLGSRAFSINFAAGPAPVNTQLVVPPTNTVVPVFVTYGGATFTVKGLTNSTASNVVTRDMHAINGVVHEIDQVLRPQ